MHLFISSTSEPANLIESYTFLKTCYPAYASDKSKGWCTIRNPGVFENENEKPQPDSGWGFCSTNPSQEDCNNGRITDFKPNDTPHKVSFFSDENCLGLLEKNLKVDQPKEVDGFKEKIDPLGSFCTGQIFKHSFASEKFVTKSQSYNDISHVTPSMKVNIALKIYGYICISIKININ